MNERGLTLSITRNLQSSSLSFINRGSLSLLPLQPLYIYWALFTGGILCMVLHFMLGDALPGVKFLLYIASSVNCGLAWLLARALFRPGDMARWPAALVALLFMIGLFLITTKNSSLADGVFINGLYRVYTLISSTVLLMTMLEAMDGIGRSTSAERTFRIIFMSVYGFMLLFGVVWLRASSDGDPQAWQELARVGCATLAVIGASAAVLYRSKHPLPVGISRTKQKTKSTVATDPALAENIRSLLVTEEIFRDPELKVADLSARLGQPEYKVTQCITGPLGYANFNRMMNHYRIEAAKDMLVDPAMAEHSILSIALDCGFGSIGPFNRAFKQQLGMTPSAFRTVQQS